LITQPFRALEVQQAANAPGVESGSASTVRNLVRGLADEIGNPLMFALGYIQLLRLETDRVHDAETVQKLDLVRTGLSRIDRSLQKLRILVEPQRPVLRAVDPRPLIQAAIDQATSGQRRAQPPDYRYPQLPPLVPVWVQVDADLLLEALRLLLELCLALVDERAKGLITEQVGGHWFRLLIQVPMAERPYFALARAFEPYALGELLRGSEVGLNLALARTLLASFGAELEIHRALDGTMTVAACLPLEQSGEGAR
jgi:signal transduction histidine kinase